MPKYVAAIDQGTTSTRFIIFDHSGSIAAVDQKEHTQIYPKPGWVEHDPQEIWQSVVNVIRKAVAQSRRFLKDSFLVLLLKRFCKILSVFQRQSLFPRTVAIAKVNPFSKRWVAAAPNFIERPWIGICEVLFL